MLGLWRHADIRAMDMDDLLDAHECLDLQAETKRRIDEIASRR
jgi:hypothetical protein